MKQKTLKNRDYNAYYEIMKERNVKIMPNNIVLYKRKKVGTVRKFCCGTDFRLTKRKMALFSIMKCRSNEDLCDSIEALLSIKIPPRKQFHWNFSIEIAKSEKKLLEYEKKLNEL